MSMGAPGMNQSAQRLPPVARYVHVGSLFFSSILSCQSRATHRNQKSTIYPPFQPALVPGNVVRDVKVLLCAAGGADICAGELLPLVRSFKIWMAACTVDCQ